MRWQVAGKSDIFSGFVKILKHSARSVLLIIDGSKVMFSLFFFADLFLAFLDAVSECYAPGWAQGSLT